MNSGIDGPVMDFPSIESIAPTGWSVPMAMEDRTIHVWGFSLEGNPSFVERCRCWLSQDERGRAARFIRQQDHVQFVLAHGALRAVLSRYLGIGPDAVAMNRSETGKPSLARMRDDQPRITFNISHAHGRALIAVSKGQEIGVDLERLRLDVEVAKLSQRYFTPSEHTTIMQVTQAQRAAKFFRYWVAKEAVLKAQGIGIQALSQCEILMSADGISAEILVPTGLLFQDDWSVRFLSCGEGWDAAVAAQGMDWVVRDAREMRDGQDG